MDGTSFNGYSGLAMRQFRLKSCGSSSRKLHHSLLLKRNRKKTNVLFNSFLRKNVNSLNKSEQFWNVTIILLRGFWRFITRGECIVPPTVLGTLTCALANAQRLEEIGDSIFDAAFNVRFQSNYTSVCLLKTLFEHLNSSKRAKLLHRYLKAFVKGRLACMDEDNGIHGYFPIDVTSLTNCVLSLGGSRSRRLDRRWHGWQR